MAALSSRRKFSPQFKAEAVQLVIQGQRPIVEVAGELSIKPGHAEERDVSSADLRHPSSSPVRCGRVHRGATAWTEHHQPAATDLPAAA